MASPAGFRCFERDFFRRNRPLRVPVVVPLPLLPPAYGFFFRERILVVMGVRVVVAVVIAVVLPVWGLRKLLVLLLLLLLLVLLLLLLIE